MGRGRIDANIRCDVQLGLQNKLAQVKNFTNFSCARRGELLKHHRVFLRRLEQILTVAVLRKK
jgi:hypothetical protein